MQFCTILHVMQYESINRLKFVYAHVMEKGLRKKIFRRPFVSRISRSEMTTDLMDSMPMRFVLNGELPILKTKILWDFTEVYR